METWLGEEQEVNPSSVCQIFRSTARRVEVRAGIAIIYCDSVPFAKVFCLLITSFFACIHLVVGDKNGIGILLLYSPPCCLNVSLPEEFRFPLCGTFQEFLAIVITMDLSQIITVPTPCKVSLPGTPSTNCLYLDRLVVIVMCGVSL